MRRVVLVVACAAAILAGEGARRGNSIAGGGKAFGQSSASATAPPSAARMEEVIQSFVAKKQFMGAVLVARGNDVLFDKGYGSADLEWNVPNSDRTKFRLGSITKQFTAASILLLEERGKLSVDDPVKKYMPDAPQAWDKITIFNLLTHTSGIPSFTGFPEYEKLEPFATPPEQLVARFRDKPLDFQPGEKWSYSNSGYVLLGYLLEKISGQSYPNFVQENIFKPLGMEDSGYDSNSAIIPERASGYMSGPQGFTNAGYINMTVPFSAGALYSTTRDLLKWEQGLFGGKVLSAASLKKMTTPFKNDYAFGLEVHKVDGQEVIEHGGGIEGFNTMLAYYPEDKLTLIVLGNVNGRAPDEIARDLGMLVHGGKVVLTSERKTVPVDPKIFDGYVGNYELMPNFIISITRDGDHLFAQATGQQKFEIFPETQKDYFYKVVDAQITFVTDSSGRATALILHQNGDNRAERVNGPTPAAPPEHKEAHVNPKIFDGYVGSYQLVPGFVITITRDGDHLFEQATNQPKFEIFPESDKTYFLKVVDAQITFVTDTAGRASELILHQGGMDQHAKRID